MKGKKRLLIVPLIIIAVYFFVSNPKAKVRWFRDQTYNSETLRTIGEGVFGGAEVSEVQAAIAGLKEGDDEGWFNRWSGMAERLESRSKKIVNRVSRGNLLLRACNYYRTAEFFLHPEDKRRKTAFSKSAALFLQALKDLRVKHEVLKIPYKTGYLKSIYYPGESGFRKRPLIMVHGGYDSTQEESYFIMVKAALQRGYPVLTYAGPGQGEALRKYGLTFTHKWEKPTGAVLNNFIKKKGKPKKIILIGISLGGYLAPRAAAFDKRINGVAAFNVCYDLQEGALKQAPWFVRKFYEKGLKKLVNLFVGMKMKIKPGVRWGIRNGLWTMGVKTPWELITRFGKFNLRETASLITGDVFITAGEKDHFFPVEQVSDFKNALVNARSVTTRVFTRDEGGHEHNQLGAFSLFHEELFEWVEKTF